MPKLQSEITDNSNSSFGRGWWLAGAIVLFLFYLFSSFLGIGYYFSGIFRIVFLIGAIALVVLFFTQKSNKKVYKPNLPPQKMKIQYIFYTVGVLFIFASVGYFTREFISELPDPIKLILLIVSVVVTFIIAEFLRGAEK